MDERGMAVNIPAEAEGCSILQSVRNGTWIRVANYWKVTDDFTGLERPESESQ